VSERVHWRDVAHSITAVIGIDDDLLPRSRASHKHACDHIIPRRAHTLPQSNAHDDDEHQPYYLLLIIIIIILIISE
jgi:hypothetical protein